MTQPLNTERKKINIPTREEHAELTQLVEQSLQDLASNGVTITPEGGFSLKITGLFKCLTDITQSIAGVSEDAAQRYVNSFFLRDMHSYIAETSETARQEALRQRLTEGVRMNPVKS